MAIMQIDRFEGGYAVCLYDNGGKTDIKISELPSEVKEGDVLNFNGERYSIDIEQTRQRREQIQKLFDQLAQTI